MSPQSPGAWFALNVRTAGEAKVKKALEAQHYTVYLPTYLDARPYSDRIKTIRRALFPGYLFSTFNPLNRQPILATPGVQSIVCVAGNIPEPILESELEAIRRALDSGVEAIPWPYLRSGDRVVVQYGSLTGVEGTIVRQSGGDRLVLAISLLQRAISVQIDRAWVRPAAAKALIPTAGASV